jgi:CheY-like chemotaxis protein
MFSKIEAGQGAAAMVPGSMTASRVLVVDDERKTRELVAERVREHGCTVLTASTAYEAIHIVGIERPDVIIVDGLLPQMHGFELARFFRAMDRQYRPRIVLMTAIYKNTRYQNEAKLKYGIDSYLIKPFSSEQLEEALSCAVAC